MNLKAHVLEVSQFGSGNGLPVLLLHEGLGSVAMWREFPEQLAAASARQVIAWSRKGYGSSDDFVGPYSPDFMHREADAAADLMQELGIDRAHVFGHSDGATIALLLAARHPHRVASLVLEAPHVFVEPMCLTAIEALGQVAGNGNMVARLGKYHRDAAAVFDQWHAIWTDPEFASWNIEAELGCITCPTLLIQGENDEFGTFEQIDRVAARLPQSRQLRLPNCGHSPHRDQEGAVLAASAAFMQEFANG
ncbi:MAG: alpha/beta hydrolase [Sphingorhabdus sp.]|nr:alpha/beta hydrolase [Sphingorhabdus sp.]